MTPRNPPATATAAPRFTATASATAEAPAEIGGRISYYRSESAVSDASIASDHPTGVSTNSGIDGRYRLLGLPRATQELSVTKRGDHRGAIDAADAASVLEAVSRLRALDPIEQAACDVDGNRRLDRRDAEQILDLVVGIRDRFDAALLCNSDWLFFADPERHALSPFERAALREGCSARATIIEAAGAVLPQDFQAVLLGNCSGDWPPAIAPAALVTVDERQVIIERPRRSRTDRMRVPIVIDAATDFSAAEIVLSFDAARLRPVRVRTRFHNRHHVVRFGSDGGSTLTIVMASAKPQPSGQPLMLLLDLIPLDRSRVSAQPPVVEHVRLSGH